MHKYENWNWFRSLVFAYYKQKVYTKLIDHKNKLI
jgi:hypothetical protein